MGEDGTITAHESGSCRSTAETGAAEIAAIGYERLLPQRIGGRCRGGMRRSDYGARERLLIRPKGVVRCRGDKRRSGGDAGQKTLSYQRMPGRRGNSQRALPRAPSVPRRASGDRKRSDQMAGRKEATSQRARRSQKAARQPSLLCRGKRPLWAKRASGRFLPFIFLLILPLIHPASG